MSDREAAPRAALLAAIMIGGGTWALMQPIPSNPIYAALYAFMRPAAVFGVAVGILVAVVALVVWKRAQRERDGFRRTGFTSRDLRQLSPEQFEEWCADRLREQGYRVTVVGGQSDHGVDLLAERDGALTAVQCKRWFGVRLVGEPQIRDLLGAMQHEQASSAMVITTGQFSEAATKWAQGKPIRLWGVEQLLAGSSPAVIKPTTLTAGPQQQCPSCGRNLLRRVNRRTQDVFWGCAGYPSCRYTRAT
jgi:restriction system protein